MNNWISLLSILTAITVTNITLGNIAESQKDIAQALITLAEPSPYTSACQPDIPLEYQQTPYKSH